MFNIQEKLKEDNGHVFLESENGDLFYYNRNKNLLKINKSNIETIKKDCVEYNIEYNEFVEISNKEAMTDITKVENVNKLYIKNISMITSNILNIHLTIIDINLTIAIKGIKLKNKIMHKIIEDKKGNFLLCNENVIINMDHVDHSSISSNSNLTQDEADLSFRFLYTEDGFNYLLPSSRKFTERILNHNKVMNKRRLIRACNE